MMTQEDWDGMSPDEQRSLIDSVIQSEWDELQQDIEDVIDLSKNDEWNAKIGARLIVGHIRKFGYIITPPEKDSDE